MPRISSEKTRQVILVKDPVFDDTQVPERLAMFDEEHKMVSINLVPKGEWSGVAGYAENDLVTFEGSTYLAKAAKDPVFGGDLNPNPSLDTDTWGLLAARGGPGLNWRGTWASTETYTERDLVFYGGSSYRALMDVGSDTPPPGTPEHVIPGSGRIAGMESLLWDTSSLVRTGTVSDTDPVDAGGYHVEIVRIPIGTAGQIQVDVDYVDPTMDGYLELWRPDGSMQAGNDDFGPLYHSRVAGAVSPGLYYIVFRYRNPGPVPNSGSSPYSATIAFTAGATFGADVGNRWEVIAEKGDAGPIGPDGPPGPIAVFRGLYNSGDAYDRGDTVYYEGESWWASADIPAGTAPVTSATWYKVVQKGDVGPIGPVGPEGPAGVGEGGVGIPVGGILGQLLYKTSAINYEAEWADPPIGFDFRGAWVAQAYPRYALVRHVNALWIASEEAAESTDIPGDVEGLVSFQASGYTAARGHTRLATDLKNWACADGEANYAYFFFDVTTGGTLTLNKNSNALGYMKVYNGSTGAEITATGNDYTATFAVGRYYVRIEGLNTAVENGTIKIDQGTGVVSMGAVNPWLLVLQGVA